MEKLLILRARQIFSNSISNIQPNHLETIHFNAFRISHMPTYAHMNANCESILIMVDSMDKGYIDSIYIIFLLIVDRLSHILCGVCIKINLCYFLFLFSKQFRIYFSQSSEILLSSSFNFPFRLRLSFNGTFCIVQHKNYRYQTTNVQRKSHFRKKKENQNRIKLKSFPVSLLLFFWNVNSFCVQFERN